MAYWCRKRLRTGLIYTSSTRADGAAVQRTFDGQDKLMQLVDPVGVQWQWEYDPAGNLLAETNARGNKTHYAYAQGRLQRALNAAKKLTACSYDEAGNLLEVRNEEDQRQRWLHDGWGRALKLTDARGNVQWGTYDLLSRVATVHEPDENVRRFAYDGLNNVVRMQDRRYDVQLRWSRNDRQKKDVYFFCPLFPDHLS